jgi:L-alanine-DL-glutamate epimerase-like enolase superfamily enzyme
VKIHELRAVPVRVPRTARFLPKTAHGEVATSEYVVLEIEDHDGAVGVGEVTCSPRWNGEEAAGTIALARGVLAPALAGLDPSAWPDVSARLDAAFTSRPFLRAGIEMACLDLVARHHGRSAADMLGGVHRDRVPTKFVLPARDPELVRAMAGDLAHAGIKVVKVKVGTGADGDISRVSAVRHELGPDVSITVDANEGWQPEEARRIVAALDHLGVTAVEQPLPRAAWTASASLSSNTLAAIIGDESIWALPDVLRSAQTGAFDMVSVYPGKCGGLRATLVMAETASALGLGVTFGSNLELGVGAAALAHVIAASPVLSSLVPADLIGPLYFESSLITDPSFIGWGTATLPPGPGLGVQLDAEALARYRTDR